MMKNFHKIQLFSFFTLVFCIPNLISQDTLYINVEEAIELAKKNCLNLNRYNLGTETNRSKPFKPLNIDYSYGHLYSNDLGWRIEASQEFGPLFNKKKNNELNQSIISYNLENNLLQGIELEIKVRTAYNKWLFYINLLDLIKSRKQYYQNYSHFSKLKYELGEIEPFKEAMALLHISEVETEYLECLYNIDISEIQLRKYIGIDNPVRPLYFKFELYQVKKKYDTSKYNGKYYSDVLLSNLKIEEALTQKIKLKKRLRYEAGLFYQNIENLNIMTGFHAGIKIPIWNNEVNEELEKRTVALEKLYIEYLNVKKTTELEIRNLILELDKRFITIRHYQNNALPAANLLLSTSETKFKVEEIDFEEYIESVSQALKIKQEYLIQVYNYNQAAIQLEKYTK